MKICAYLTAGLLVVVALQAQTNLRVETQRLEWNENYSNVRLKFDSEPNRRFLIEVSQDLNHWQPHYLAPFAYAEEGYVVRTMDHSNPYTPKSEFYRVTRIPWLFQTVISSNDWIGDVSLAGNGSLGFLVFQNRDANELYYTKSDTNGFFNTPELIATTGAENEPGFWNNSGFSDLTLHHYDETLYIVCTDFIAKKVVLLWKDMDQGEWNRHEISEVITSHFWAFPQFTISESGILGVAFADDSGTVFAYANSVSPAQWNSVLVTGSKPDNRQSIRVAFSSATDAHVFVRYSGSFKIDTQSDSVVTASFPSDPPSDLTENEIDRISQTYRSETPSEHIRLSDGRILFVLGSSGRIIIAVED